MAAGGANRSPTTDGGFVGFGISVALDGEHALVTSPVTGVLAIRLTGGEWRAAGTLTYAGAEPQDRAGRTLAARGGVAFLAVNGHAGIRSPYSFRLDEGSGTWVEVEHITPADTTPGQEFGRAFALAGDRLWIGAPGADRHGAVTEYARDAATGEWRVASHLAAPGLRGEEGFGGAIGVNGSVLAVGLTGADFGAGKAMIFESRAAGAFTLAGEMIGETAPEYAAVTGTETRCETGKASVFGCGQADLLAFLPISAIGGGRGVQLNDIWGWTDPETGKEYALVGRIDGTAFVDISDPANPIYVGQLLRTEGSPASAWRDIKVYKDHAFIVSDAARAHGMQVFDLTRLRQYRGEPITFTVDAHYDRIHSAHNIAINEETGFAYPIGNSSGGETCGGGLHMIDIREPKNPRFAGCFSDPLTGNAGTGYSHDAQCVLYRGPDAEHRGREICVGSNETAISIADVTDKANPKALARASYPNVAYTHQGWFTDDQRYFFVDDEGDEVSGTVPRTRTLVWDLADLDDPVLVKEHLGETAASDHNLYIRGNLMYQSNYASGLRILDITDPANPVEVGFFDTNPAGENKPGFNGSWSNYPFFGSGVIAVSSIEQGLFLVRYRPRPVS